MESRTRLRNSMPRDSLRERLDKATLEKLYCEVGLSSVQLAERFGVRPNHVRKLMAEYGIPRRPRGAQVR